MRRYWLVFSQAVTVLLAAWFVVATLKPELLNRRPVMTASTGVRWWKRRPPRPRAAAGQLPAAAQKARRPW
jgi:hypothetical protein